MKEMLQGGLDLLLPPRCLYCDSYLGRKEQLNHLCSHCFVDICYIQSPLCTCCGISFSNSSGGSHLCGECLRSLPPYYVARAAVSYTPVVKYLLHRLKYGGDTTVLPTMNWIISQMDSTIFSSVDLIVPVPLHINRLRKRGLNQSLTLTRLFFPRQQHRIQLNYFIRTRDTSPQASLNGEKRRKNLHGAFKVTEPSVIRNKSICLVDDVFTTGTTVSECSKTLMRAGAKQISVITFARAEKG